jgi:hypothetical protein
MSTVVKGSGGATYTPHPEGQFPAVCVDVQDLGWETSEKYGKTQYKIRLVFFCGQWTEEKEVEIEGQRVKKRFPMTVSKKFTASLHEKSVLRPFAKSWRGSDFTPQELKDGFDFERMYKAPALIQVGHYTYEGETYAGIDSIMRLRDKAEAPALPAEYTRLKDRDDWDGPAPHPNMSPKSNADAAPEPADDSDDLPF